MLVNKVDINNYLEKKVNEILNEMDNRTTFSWDMVDGDCPLGWDVSVYFNGSSVFGEQIHKVVNTIHKAITGYDFKDWDYIEIEHTNEWLKVMFQADLINR